MDNCADTLDQVREDYRVLDLLDTAGIDGDVLSSEDFPGEQHRKVVRGGLCRLPWIGEWLFALRLLLQCRGQCALLLNQVERAAQYACILNYFTGGRKNIVLYDVFIDTPSAWKRRVVAWMVRGATLNVVFSRSQVKGYAKLFGLPARRFVFIPYQSSHSKRPPANEPVGDYVWSGGNSARDYDVLIEAVRGTEVPLVLTTTRKEVREQELPDNITLRPAQEPEFTKLMAGSRFVVITMTPGRVRGYGEQSMLNGMWHGRAVIAADDVSAQDYIIDGVNGYTVAPGDAAALRARILELWNDPEGCRAMGERASTHVAEGFSHEFFVQRIVGLSQLLAAGER